MLWMLADERKSSRSSLPQRRWILCSINATQSQSNNLLAFDIDGRKIRHVLSRSTLDIPNTKFRLVLEHITYNSLMIPSPPIFNHLRLLLLHSFLMPLLWPHFAFDLHQLRCQVGRQRLVRCVTCGIASRRKFTLVPAEHKIVSIAAS